VSQRSAASGQTRKLASEGGEGKMVRKLGMALRLVLVASPAWATAFTDGVTVDTAPVFVIAGIVLTAIGGIWAIKKVVKLLNRS
jgi:hypothetical protein